MRLFSLGNYIIDIEDILSVEKLNFAKRLVYKIKLRSWEGEIHINPEEFEELKQHIKKYQIFLELKGE
jgi:hypothetical protein